MKGFLKAIASIATCAAVSFAAVPVLSHGVHRSEGPDPVDTPVQLDWGHEVLIQVVQSTGMPIIYDHPLCDDGLVAGFYNGKENLFAVCKFDGPWTPYHLDTLRHEAQHLVQDCLDGRIDYVFPGTFLEDPIEYAKSIGFTDKQLNGIRIAYASLSYEEYLMEVEAFAVAASVDPKEIANAILNLCPAGA